MLRGLERILEALEDMPLGGRILVFAIWTVICGLLGYILALIFQWAMK